MGERRESVGKAPGGDKSSKRPAGPEGGEAPVGVAEGVGGQLPRGVVSFDAAVAFGEAGREWKRPASADGRRLSSAPG